MDWRKNLAHNAILPKKMVKSGHIWMGKYENQGSQQEFLSITKQMICYDNKHAQYNPYYVHFPDHTIVNFMVRTVLYNKSLANLSFKSFV